MYVFVCPVVDMKISVGGSSCEIKERAGAVGSLPLSHNAELVVIHVTVHE